MSRISRLRAFAKPALHRSFMVLCAILTLAILGIWIRSYDLSERYRMVRMNDAPGQLGARSLSFNSGFGGVQLWFFTVSAKDSDVLRQFLGSRRYAPGYFVSHEPVYPPMRGSPEDSLLNSLGIQTYFWSGTTEEGLSGLNTWITLPYWLPFLLALAYPGFWYVSKVVRRQQEDRLAAGLCPRCGEPIDELSPRCRGCDKPVCAAPRSMIGGGMASRRLAISSSILIVTVMLIIVASMVLPAAGQTLTPSSQPTVAANPDPSAWRERFDSVYQLKDGENLKHIAPPFMPERLSSWMIDFAVRSQAHPEPPNCFDFIVAGNQRRMRSAFFEEDQTLLMLLTDLFGLRFYDYDAPPDLLKTPLPGDWIIRGGAEKDPATMEELAAILSQIRGKPVRISRQTIDQDVIVASGKWNLNQIKEARDGVHFYIDILDPPAQTVASQSRESVLTTLERRVYRRVINEAADVPQTVPVFFHDSARAPQRLTAPESEEKTQKLLQTLSDQTSLKFSRAKRPFEVWSFEEGN